MRALVALTFVLGASSIDIRENDLQFLVQELVQRVGNTTGWSVSVGLVDDEGHNFGVGGGPRGLSMAGSELAGSTTGRDRFNFGSGTKGLTATAVMRLVDQGRFSLDDPAHWFIDPVLRRALNKSMSDMLGSRAVNVTIGHLIQMRSGVADFDVPDYDNSVLMKGNTTHSPFEVLQFVSRLNDTICDADGSGACQCRFEFEPGMGVSYSSTNFVLTGLVLVGASLPQPSGKPTTWDTLDMLEPLGFRSNPAFQDSNFSFVSDGPLSLWLTVAGNSIQYGNVRIFDQDASILGWTCGNAIATTQDLARFYFELLGPRPSLVSAASLEIMTQWRVLTAGWAKGYIDYGTGLMIQNIAPGQRLHGQRPQVNQSGSYVGHAGDTYGFTSENGYFQSYNTSLSVAVNQDNGYGSELITCLVLEIVAVYHGDTNATAFGCRPLPDPPLYACKTVWGLPTCILGWGSSYQHEANLTQAECNTTCGVTS